MVKKILNIQIDLLPINALELPTLKYRDTALFSIKDSLKLLQYCQMNDIGILGVEGFHITDGKIIPEMDYVADFSELLEISNDFVNDSIKSMEKFIDLMVLELENVHEQLLLEFILCKIDF